MQESLCDLLDGAGKESLEISICREASDRSPKAFWAFRRLGYLLVCPVIYLSWYIRHLHIVILLYVLSLAFFTARFIAQKNASYVLFCSHVKDKESIE